MDGKQVNSVTFFAIFFLALSIRLLYCLTLEPLTIRGDAANYAQYAINLIDHFTFSKERGASPEPDSYWAPGYPIFLSISMLLAKFIGVHFYVVALVLQSVMGGAVAAFSFKLGRLVLSYKSALLAALLTTISPHLISHGAYILSETLFSLLLILSVYFYIRALTSEKRCLYITSGFLFGASYLTNPVALVVPCLLLAYSFFFKMENKKDVATFFLSFLVVVAAWNVRGLYISDVHKSTHDRAFENLVIGSHYNYHDIWKNNPRNKNNPYEIDMEKYGNDHSAFYKELAKRIINDPVHYSKWYLIQKPLDLWGWDILVGQGDIYVYPTTASLYSKSSVALASWALMKNTHYLLLACCLLGLFFLIREKGGFNEAVIAIYILLGSISLVYLILHSDARYSVPMRPEMYICAAYVMKIIFKFKWEFNK